MTQISMGAVVMVMDLMQAQLFDWAMMTVLVRILLYLIQTIVDWYMPKTKKDILILGKGPTQGLGYTTIETEESIHFIEQ